MSRQQRMDASLAEGRRCSEAVSRAPSCGGSDKSAQAKGDEGSDSSIGAKAGATSNAAGRRPTTDLPVHSMDSLRMDAFARGEGEDASKDIPR